MTWELTVATWNIFGGRTWTAAGSTWTCPRPAVTSLGWPWWPSWPTGDGA